MSRTWLKPCDLIGCIGCCVSSHCFFMFSVCLRCFLVKVSQCFTEYYTKIWVLNVKQQAVLCSQKIFVAVVVFWTVTLQIVIKWTVIVSDTHRTCENQINHGVKLGSQSARSRCGVIYCAFSTLFMIITVSREIISNVIFVTIMNQSHPDCSEIHKAWSQQC